MRRSDQRRDAVFASYQRDVTGRPLEELIAEARPLTRELAEGVDAQREELDEAIAAHAKGWTVDRIAPLDLNVMRVALYEIEFSDLPDRGGDRRGGRDRQGVLRRRRARSSSTASSARSCASGSRPSERPPARDRRAAAPDRHRAGRARRPATSAPPSSPPRPPTSPPRRSRRPTAEAREGGRAATPMCSAERRRLMLPGGPARPRRRRPRAA